MDLKAADADSLAEALWDALNADNRISLYVRYENLQNGDVQTRIINKFE